MVGGPPPGVQGFRARGPSTTLSFRLDDDRLAAHAVRHEGAAVAIIEVVKGVVEGSTGPDTWSCGFYAQCAGAVTAAQLDALCGAWDSDNKSEESPNAYVQIAGANAAGTSIDRISTYYYPELPGKASEVAERAVSQDGQATGHYAPLQQAIVVTLNTNQAGRRKRGRIYTPASGVPMDASHSIGQGEMDAVAAAWAAMMGNFLDAVRANGGGDTARIVVASVAGGYTTEVTGLSIDSRPDVVRARANKQAGHRTTYTGPNPVS